MANVLTNLAADIYKAADIVGRELVGAIPAAIINSDASQQAAKGDTIRAAFTREPTLNTTFAPAMTIPEGDDQTVDNKTMTVDSYANVRIPYTGEDIKHLNNGAGFETVYGDQIVQAMRKIVNKMEQDFCLALKNGSGNAVGTSGTTPFASDFSLIADARKLLVDRGMPWDGAVSLVMNTAAGTNLRKLSALYKVNESGGNELLRQGVLLDIYGCMLRESAQIASHTKGTGASYLVDLLAGYAVGDKTIHVDTGTGTLLQGDIITFGGDTERYVIGTGFAGDGDGDIVLNAGLIEAIANDEAVALQNSYTANIMLHRGAAEFAMRPVAMPFGGDAAVDTMTVRDPWSGLIFNLAVYKGYQKAIIDISCLYGYKVWKPEFVCTVQG